MPARAPKLICRSRNNTVIPEPSTGRVVNKSTETINIVQTTRSQCKLGVPHVFANCIEIINVIAPASEENPNICNDKIAKLTAELLEKSAPVSGK